MTDRRRPSAASKDVVAKLMRDALAPLPEIDPVDAWNARAERICAQLRRDHPRAKIIQFRKRKAGGVT